VDISLVVVADVLHVGGPDVLGRFAGAPLADVLAAARAGGTLVTMDLLRPGAPEVLDRLAPLLGLVDYFLPNSDQLLAITGAAALRARAAAVIPGGMYGHQSVAGLPAAFPQFMARGTGARVWDVDGREYVDLMCSYGPVILGHQHPMVEAAAEAQRQEADCQN